MSILGFTPSNTVGFEITNFDSTGPCTGDNAQLTGTSVCDDVILIPINSGTEVQFVEISVYNNFLTLCEVQVFAGNFNTISQISTRSNYNNFSHCVKSRCLQVN